MIKVADIVSYRFLPYNSGGQKYISQFTEQLGKKIDLYVIGTWNNQVQQKTSYKYNFCLKQNPFSYVDLIGLIKIYKFLKSNQITFLIIEHPYLGWMGILLKKLLKLKLIIHTHNIEYQRFRSLGKKWWWLLGIYEKWILTKADLIFCISEEDKNWMTMKMQISETKCQIIPYGIEHKSIPIDKKECKQLICRKYNLDERTSILMFNGQLSYKPNIEAVEIIIEQILPRLFKNDFQFNLLITGNGLPENIQNKLKQFNNAIYTGFVNDIELYNKAADIFINPVISGGGVKTKLIDALAMNCICISTENGAMGINKKSCKGNLIICEDDNWEMFTNEIIKAKVEDNNTSIDFYKYYSWDSITDRLLSVFERPFQ